MSFGRTNNTTLYFHSSNKFSHYWLEICIPKHDTRVRQELMAQLNILPVIISEKNGNMSISLDHLPPQDAYALNQMAEACHLIQTTLTNKMVAKPSREITDKFLSPHIKFCQKPLEHHERGADSLRLYNLYFNKFSTALKNIKNSPLDRGVLLNQKQCLMNILNDYLVKLQRIETRLLKYGAGDNKVKIIQDKIAQVKKEQEMQQKLDWAILYNKNNTITNQALKKAVLEARNNISNLISLDVEKEPRLHELFTHRPPVNFIMAGLNFFRKSDTHSELKAVTKKAKKKLASLTI